MTGAIRDVTGDIQGLSVVKQRQYGDMHRVNVAVHARPGDIPGMVGDIQRVAARGCVVTGDSQRVFGDRNDVFLGE
ncbi:MAG TPA: hypothetical protein VF765_16700 [Polyangiaceae bacterium]